MRVVDPVADQASGLRRLLMRPPAQAWRFVGCESRVGATSLAVNLAAVLVQAGEEVLMLDEHLSSTNVGNMLFVKPRHDLLQVIRGDKALSDVMLKASARLQVLPVARAVRELPRLSPTERQRLYDCLSAASSKVEVVLVDAGLPEKCLMTDAGLSMSRLVLVTECTAGGITACYRQIKRLAYQGQTQPLHVLVNQVPRGCDAQSIFDHLAGMAYERLKVPLTCLGYVPVDDRFSRATQWQGCVATSFPGSAAARALTAIGVAMARMKAGIFPDSTAGRMMTFV